MTNCESIGPHSGPYNAEGDSITPNFSLSWTVESGVDARGGSQKARDWRHIESFLEGVQNRSGTVTLHILHQPENGPQLLQVFAENGQYLIMLGEIVNDNYEVRSYWNENTEPGSKEILGEFWDTRSLCSDFSVVRQVFAQFFRDGDVPRDLLR